jgi:transposase
MKQVSQAKRAECLLMLQHNLSSRDIRKKLGISFGTITNVRSQFGLTATNLGGRRKLVSAQDGQRLARLILSGKADNATQLHKIAGLPVSVQTIRNSLKAEGLTARVKVKKPLFKPRHFRDRLKFAQKYQYWTRDDWKRVIFSDETKINRMGSDGRTWVWGIRGSRRTRREVQTTVKHGGGSTMIWGCFTSQGVGRMCQVDGIMDSKVYAQILDAHLIPSARSFGMRGRDFIFQQDGDPKHKSARLRDYFEDHRIQLLDWPAQSPDLNPIEHLWNHLKRQLNAYERHPSSMHELEARIKAEWRKIPMEVCEKLVNSMPDRIAQVLERKGGWTDY